MDSVLRSWSKRRDRLELIEKATTVRFEKTLFSKQFLHIRSPHLNMHQGHLKNIEELTCERENGEQENSVGSHLLSASLDKLATFLYCPPNKTCLECER